MAKKKTAKETTSPNTVLTTCDGSHLQFPEIGIILIQTFTLDRSLIFCPPDGLRGYISRCETNEEVSNFLWYRNLQTSSPRIVEHFNLKGFDFHYFNPALFRDSDDDFEVKGHCNVKMDLFFGKTVSITYRFNFDGKNCSANETFDVDRILELVMGFIIPGKKFSTSLDETIPFRPSAHLDIPFTANGHLPSKATCQVDFNDEESIANAMKEIMLRYKSFIVQNCTSFRNHTPHSVRKSIREDIINDPDDDRYAFIDIPYTLKHVNENGEDLFSEDNPAPVSNREVIEHIKTFHKKELMGILSMCPGIWYSRSEDLFDSICGPDITLDTDDFVCVGDKVAICVQTYYRGHNPWESLRQIELERYGVSWPECLMMIQFYLAQRTVIRNATKVLLRNALNSENESNLGSAITSNQETNFSLAQSMLQFEAVQYYYIINASISEKIVDRLKIASIKNKFEHQMSTIDNSLRSIKDSQSSSREVTMNVILGIVSVISAFQLFFVGTNMPFLSEYWHVNSKSFGGLLITTVAGVCIFAILLLFYSILKAIFRRFK